MKNLNLLFILFILLTTFFVRCSKSGNKGDGTITLVTINDTEMMVCSQEAITDKQIVPLSELVESCELIRFETSEEALFKPWWTIVSENYIGIRQEDANFKLFDRSGKFLCDVGSIGQGPGEYPMSIKDEIIDEKNGLIYFVTFIGDKILTFDMKGNHIKDIPLPQKFNKPVISLSDEGILSILQLPFENDPNFAIQIDLEGNVVKELPKQENFLCTIYDHEIFSYKNTDAFDFFYTAVDTLFHFDAKRNKLQPVYKIVLPPSLSKYPWIHFCRELPDRYLTWVYNVETHKSSLISTNKKNQTSSYIKIINDYYGGMEVPVLSFNKGYFAQNIEPGELIDLIEKRLTEKDCSRNDKEKLKTLLKTLDENSNNLLFVGKLKQ